MTPGDHRAVEGLLQELGRAGPGLDVSFVARVLAAAGEPPLAPRVAVRPRVVRRAAPRRRSTPWWRVAAAALLVAGLALAATVWYEGHSGSSAPTVPAVPLPSATAPAVAPAATVARVVPVVVPRAPQLIPLSSGSASYGYACWLPPALGQEPGRRWPLLLFLHGLKERGNGEDQLVPALVKYGPGRLLADGTRLFDEVLVVAPQSPAHWERITLVAFLTQLQKRYPIDPARLYLVGISDGGGASWWTALANGNLLAGIVPICGAGSWAPTVPFRAPAPACWAVHGADDPVVPPDWTRSWMTLHAGATVAAMATGEWVCRGKIWQPLVGDPRPSDRHLLSMPTGTGHDSWTAACADLRLWQWLFAQRKNP